MTDYMRAPSTCSCCGVMGHNIRGCLVIRLRATGGSDYTQEEEERVKAHLREEFQNSATGIRWARYQSEQAERRERSIQRNLEQMRDRDAEVQAYQERRERERRERERSERELLNAAGSGREPDLTHTFTQIQSWVRRAQREMNSAMDNARRERNSKTLSLKMVSNFQENYTVDTECSICYENMPNIGLPCKHTFCGECTVKFSKKSRSCPLCRSDFREITICRDIEPEEFNKISAKLYL